MMRSNPPYRPPLLALLIGGIIVLAGVFLLRVPVIGWCAGALLVLALVIGAGAALDVSRRVPPMQRIAFFVVNLVNITLLLWVCGLSMLAGALVILPMHQLQALKRRLALRAFRHQASAASVNVTTLAELKRLQSGAHFTLTAPLYRIVPKMSVMTGGLTLIFRFADEPDDIDVPPRARFFSSIIQVTLRLPDGEFTGVLRGPVVSMAAHAAGDGPRWINLREGDAVTIGGQIGLKDAANPGQPRYVILRLETTNAVQFQTPASRTSFMLPGRSDTGMPSDNAPGP